MNEEKAAKLFRGVTGIGDDLIEEAQTAQTVGKDSKKPVWRRWGGLAACLCLAVLAGAGAWRWMGPGSGPEAPGNQGTTTAGAGIDMFGAAFSEDTDAVDEAAAADFGEAENGAADSQTGGLMPGADGYGSWEDGGCTLPGGIVPVLRVGDVLYRWTRIAQKIELDLSGAYSIMGTADTYLPEGYEPYGEIGGVTGDGPAVILKISL